MVCFLDNFSTTQIDKRVLSEMMPYLREQYGNPSSTHRFGIQAREAVELARDRVARLINCCPDQIIFTSGATEANNMVINQPQFRKVCVSSIEHKSVFFPAKKKEFLTIIHPEPNGQIDIKKIDTKQDLISIMAVNNEMGAVQNIGELSDRAKGVFLHVDMAQALGKVIVNMGDLCVDFASFSAHKIHGPKGIGALYVKDYDLKPIMYGGGQENGIRSGTLNVAGIIGFGKACDILSNHMDEIANKIYELRDCFMNEWSRIPNARCITFDFQVPNAISAVVPCDNIDEFLNRCDNEEIFVSTSSACLSSFREPSNTLIEMGIERKVARRILRICLSRMNTRRQIKVAVKKMAKIMEEVNEKSMDYNGHFVS